MPKNQTDIRILACEDGLRPLSRQRGGGRIDLIQPQRVCKQSSL